MTWTSAEGMLEFHAEWYKIFQNASETTINLDELAVKTLGLEYNPIDMIGLKLESTAFENRTLGLILRFASMARWRQRLEFNFTHDALSAMDEDQGFMWSAALSAGY